MATISSAVVSAVVVLPSAECASPAVGRWFVLGVGWSGSRWGTGESKGRLRMKIHLMGYAASVSNNIRFRNRLDYMGFTKLDEGILLSSIMQEDSDTFKVWIALLAACKEDGIARVSSVGISAVCFLTLETVKKSLEKLSSPDSESRSLNDDGRRIERIDGGFKIINYHKYRELSLKEREAQRKWNSRHKSEMSGSVRTTPDSSASASASSSALKEGMQGEKKKEIPPIIEDVINYCQERNNNVDPQKWLDFYASKGWMIGKNKMKDWKAAVRTWEKPNSNRQGSQQQPQLVKTYKKL
jgi:hypothetical protein